MVKARVSYVSLWLPPAACVNLGLSLFICKKERRFCWFNTLQSSQTQCDLFHSMAFSPAILSLSCSTIALCDPHLSLNMPSMLLPQCLCTGGGCH